MAENTSALTKEINKLVDSINIYNNTVLSEVDKLLAAYGLVEPLTLAQIQGLTIKQIGEIQQSIAPILAVIGKEVGRRTIEANLAKIGYTSFDAAILDCDKWFGPSAVVEARNVLTRVKNMLAVLDTLVDANSVYNSLSRIATIKKLVADTALNVARV